MRCKGLTHQAGKAGGDLGNCTYKGRYRDSAGQFYCGVHLKKEGVITRNQNPTDVITGKEVDGWKLYSEGKIILKEGGEKRLEKNLFPKEGLKKDRSNII